MYYNTNKESGETLAESRDKAQTQEDCILAYFKDGSQAFVAPHDLRLLFGHKVPITSIRRAFTNLEKGGKLLKTDKMAMGTYGKMVHTWRLKNGQTELF